MARPKTEPPVNPGAMAKKYRNVEPKITSKLDKALKIIQSQEMFVPGMRKTCPVDKNRLALELISRNFKLKKKHSYMLDYTLNQSETRNQETVAIKPNANLVNKFTTASTLTRQPVHAKSVMTNHSLVRAKNRMREMKYSTQTRSRER